MDILFIIDEPWIRENKNNIPVLADKLTEWINTHLQENVICREARKENRKKGHPWHADNCRVKGTKCYAPEEELGNPKLEWEDNHMPWCCYSASMLITDPDKFSGGELQFYTLDGLITLKKEMYDKIVLFSSGNRNIHRVTPNSGEREVNLFFFQKK